MRRSDSVLMPLIVVLAVFLRYKDKLGFKLVRRAFHISGSISIFSVNAYFEVKNQCSNIFCSKR